LAPQAPEIRYHLAEALAALGRSAEARSVLTSLLAEDPDFEQRATAQRLLDTL
jgi:FimV-like protein